QDKAFCSKEFQTVVKSFPFSVQQLTVPRFSPWLRGWYERIHRELVQALRAAINSDQTQHQAWTDTVQDCTRALNVTPYSDVSPLAPWHLVKGYPSRHDVTSHAHTTDYKSKMSLQSPRWYQDLQDLSEELREQRQVTLKGYLDFWKDRRDDMYHRAILDRGSDHRNDLSDGCV
ncbi:hypothetical protein FOZ62_019449, partial [Perkinsus olseni]